MLEEQDPGSHDEGGDLPAQDVLLWEERDPPLLGRVGTPIPTLGGHREFHFF